MADEVEDDLTPTQREYAAIGDAIGQRILAAGRQTADEIQAALEGRRRSFSPGTAPIINRPDNSMPSAMPNAGWLHIARGQGGDVSLAGRAAIGLSDLNQRLTAYGLQPPSWLNGLTTAAKIGSFAMGDTHLYGNRLRERVESFTESGPMLGPATNQPGGFAASPMSIPSATPQLAPPMNSPGGASGPRFGDDLVAAIRALTEKIDKLVEMQDDGDEDETVENKQRTEWDSEEKPERPAKKMISERPPGPVMGGGQGAPTRPHQPAAESQLGNWGETIGTIVSWMK